MNIFVSRDFRMVIAFVNVVVVLNFKSVNIKRTTDTHEMSLTRLITMMMMKLNYTLTTKPLMIIISFWWWLLFCGQNINFKFLFYWKQKQINQRKKKSIKKAENRTGPFENKRWKYSWLEKLNECYCRNEKNSFLDMTHYYMTNFTFWNDDDDFKFGEQTKTWNDNGWSMTFSSENKK